MARPGMILICEVADAPVIMGISKPADLKSQHRGGENRESTIVENYLVLYSYVP